MSIKLELPCPHLNQKPIIQDEHRFLVELCGRRFGKSVLDILECDPILHGWPVGLFFPTYKMLDDVWRSVTSAFMPAVKSLNKVEHRMELTTGGVLDAWSLEDPDKARGRKYKRVIVDEAASARNLEYGWNNVIYPSLMDLKGDARIKSTPKGMNYFWKMAHFCDNNPDWKTYHYTTYDNPFIDPKEIDGLQTQLPEMIFRQEIMAEFLQGEGAVFRNINACMKTPTVAPEAHKDHYIVAGVDWAKQADYTAISIGCATCNIELARDRFNKIDYTFQRERLMAICKHWNTRHILVELNSIGEPNFEELARAGFPVGGFTTTAQSKSPLIENLALALETEEWQFQADPIWTGELEAYERKVNAITGRSQYSAPEGMHDDTVMARALMLRAAGTRARVVDNPFDM